MEKGERRRKIGRGGRHQENNKQRKRQQTEETTYRERDKTEKEMEPYRDEIINKDARH
jgi:hypothetical protein